MTSEILLHNCFCGTALGPLSLAAPAETKIRGRVPYLVATATSRWAV